MGEDLSPSIAKEWRSVIQESHDSCRDSVREIYRVHGLIFSLFGAFFHDRYRFRMLDLERTFSCSIIRERDFTSSGVWGERFLHQPCSSPRWRCSARAGYSIIRSPCQELFIAPQSNGRHITDILTFR